MVDSSVERRAGGLLAWLVAPWHRTILGIGAAVILGGAGASVAALVILGAGAAQLARPAT